MPVITLLTDFGTRDTYVGQMKGVIAAIAPQATVVDLTHAVPPQDVLAGAIELDGAVDAFAQGTIHVGVVDPGVGSARQPIAVQTERFTFIGPDNGLFTTVMQSAQHWQAVALNEPAYHRAEVSKTFHGRDIFAPVAAHLAAGAAVHQLGPAVPSPAQLTLPGVEVQADRLVGQVLLIDHFGNLITNITAHDLNIKPGEPNAATMTLRVGKTEVRGLGQTFSDAEPGEPVAYWGSSGRLEIALRNGSAHQTLGVARGDAVVVETSK
jgi:S-adenosylmethionine hydrolase